MCFFVRSFSIFDNNHPDPTGLTAALQATDLAGVLHMLYCILFHGTISDPSSTSPKESYTQNTIQVAIQSLRFFNSFAVLDLPAFQVLNLDSGCVNQQNVTMCVFLHVHMKARGGAGYPPLSLAVLFIYSFILERISLCSPGWDSYVEQLALNLQNLPAFRGLGLKMCATMSDSTFFRDTVSH